MTRARELAKLANETTLKIDTTNTRVGIGSTVPTVRLDLKDGQIKGDGSLLTGVTGLGTAVSTLKVIKACPPTPSLAYESYTFF